MTKLTQTAVIVIPTYNEADNIGRMIEHLSTKTFVDIKHKINGLETDWNIHVLVVDGNSPDGTGDVVEFIRKGIVWEEWLENFKAGLELPDGNNKMVVE